MKIFNKERVSTPTSVTVVRNDTLYPLTNHWSSDRRFGAANEKSIPKWVTKLLIFVTFLLCVNV